MGERLRLLDHRPMPIMSLPGFTAERSLPRTAGALAFRPAGFRAPGVNVLAAAPCCDITDTKQLRVTFPHTACRPFREFVVAPRADQVVIESARPAGPGRLPGPVAAGVSGQSRRRTVWDRIFCHTSNGPWDATLVERRACIGFAPVHTLTIQAHGEPVQFIWQGGIGNHPPEVGLVSCRQVSNTQSLCPGALSTCECLSSACGANEACPCNLEHVW